MNPMYPEPGMCDLASMVNSSSGLCNDITSLLGARTKWSLNVTCQWGAIRRSGHGGIPSQLDFSRDIQLSLQSSGAYIRNSLDTRNITLISTLSTVHIIVAAFWTTSCPLMGPFSRKRIILKVSLVGLVDEVLAYEPGRQKRVLDLCTATGRWYVISLDFTLIHLIRICLISCDRLMDMAKSV